MPKIHLYVWVTMQWIRNLLLSPCMISRVNLACGNTMHKNCGPQAKKACFHSANEIQSRVMCEERKRISNQATDPCILANKCTLYSSIRFKTLTYVFSVSRAVPRAHFHKNNRQRASAHTLKKSQAIECSHVLACQFLLTLPETKKRVLKKNKEWEKARWDSNNLLRSVFMKASRKSLVYCRPIQCVFSHLQHLTQTSSASLKHT